jgi:hypothetical protein
VAADADPDAGAADLPSDHGKHRRQQQRYAYDHAHVGEASQHSIVAKDIR